MHQKVLDIVWTCIAGNENNYENLRKNLRRSKHIFQYVYSIVYPEIYCSIKKKGFDLKNQFLIAFKEYKDKKKENWLKMQNPAKTKKL